MKTVDQLREDVSKSLFRPLNEASLGRVVQHTKDRNVGMLTAHRGNLSHEENLSRNKSLEKDIRKGGYGFVHVKGRYVENHGTDQARNVDEHSYMVVGKKGEDHGELLGFLKKHGEKYQQDSVLHKSHDGKTAQLHGTSSGEHAWPGKDKVHDVGAFHPQRAGEFHSVLRNKKTFSFSEGVVEFLQPEVGVSFFHRYVEPEKEY